MVELILGIDVSKKWLDIAVIDGAITHIVTHRIQNLFPELKKFKAKLRSKGLHLNNSCLVVFEHTGVYNRILLSFLLKQKCKICIETALRIKRSSGILRGKSDTLDAKRIALYAFNNQETLHLWHQPRRTIVLIKDLLMLRDRLIKARMALEAPVKEMEESYSIRDAIYFNSFISGTVKSVNQAIKYVTSEINELVRRDNLLKRRINLLKSIPGIGQIIALYLICCTNDFTNYKSGPQLACYAGVVPFAYQSGTSIKGRTRVNHIANKKLKSLLHIAALANLRYKGANELKTYYERKVSEGKNKMSVLNAMRNKIVLRVVAVVARGTPYINKEIKKT